MPGPDAARGLEAAEPRQPNLGNDQVGAQPERLAHERVAVGHLADDLEVGREDSPQAFPNESMGVRQQDAGSTCHA